MKKWRSEEMKTYRQDWHSAILLRRVASLQQLVERFLEEYLRCSFSIYM